MGIPNCKQHRPQIAKRQPPKTAPAPSPAHPKPHAKTARTHPAINLAKKRPHRHKHHEQTPNSTPQQHLRQHPNCTPSSTQASISQITFPALLEVRSPVAFSYLGKKLACLGPKKKAGLRCQHGSKHKPCKTNAEAPKVLAKFYTCLTGAD